MRITQIKETCIYAHNLEEAKAFYHGLLGLPIINYELGKHIFFRAGSTVLLCFNPEDSKSKTSPPPHYAEGPYHFAFEVSPEDYGQVKESLESKGVKIDQTMTWRNGQESFYFKDPAGNVLEIVPHGIWE